MCGRTALALDPSDLQQRVHAARWTNRETYRPSYNIGPGRSCPVLVRGGAMPAAPGGVGNRRSGRTGTSELELHSMVGVREGGCDPSKRRALANEFMHPFGIRMSLAQQKRWGMIPHFMKQKPDNLMRTINARDDSILAKSPFWSRPRDHQRCVVPIQGFFEWQKRGKDRKPFYITPTPGSSSNDGLLYLAGLWDHATISVDAKTARYFKRPPATETGGDESGMDTNERDDAAMDASEAPPPAPPDNSDGWEQVTVFSFAIVTTSSSSSLSWLHERMPVILWTQEARDRWLDPTVPFLADVAGLMQPSETGLRWHAVNPFVNRIGNDSPECVVPAAEKKGTLFKFLKPGAGATTGKREPSPETTEREARPLTVKREGSPQPASHGASPKPAIPAVKPDPEPSYHNDDEDDATPPSNPHPSSTTTTTSTTSSQKPTLVPSPTAVPTPPLAPSPPPVHALVNGRPVDADGWEIYDAATYDAATLTASANAAPSTPVAKRKTGPGEDRDASKRGKVSTGKKKGRDDAGGGQGGAGTRSILSFFKKV
ncbi:hypothetical protein HDU96_000735 [Phlyctochytrium bullatum]|nr:hypothetical protein HDU96_000735 [Phlyctochytrium bullatum]